MLRKVLEEISLLPVDFQAIDPRVVSSLQTSYVRPQNPHDVRGAVGQELMRLDADLRAAFGLTVDDLIWKQ
jgi:hypothetical protein